jgi:hypothetical protein
LLKENNVETHSNEGRKEACKTFLEQTKLLVTLASAFVVAPAAMIPLFSGTGRIMASQDVITRFFWAELAFIFSVLAGYFTIATIAGSQHRNDFNVYRPGTRIISIIQILAYLFGLWQFVQFLLLILKQTPH